MHFSKKYIANLPPERTEGQTAGPRTAKAKFAFLRAVSKRLYSYVLRRGCVICFNDGEHANDNSCPMIYLLSVPYREHHEHISFQRGVSTFSTLFDNAIVVYQTRSWISKRSVSIPYLGGAQKRGEASLIERDRSRPRTKCLPSVLSSCT